jgi:predicted NAD/FAD-binding protein
MNMKIAVIGGGASGMVTAYLLDKQGHFVTVVEEQPMLGGHIRTLNKNVKASHTDCEFLLESGVLEFPVAFHSFLDLMQELEVELEPVQVGSGLFLADGRHFLSAVMIQKNFTGLQRLIEYLRIDTLYARSAGLWITLHSAQAKELHDHPMSYYLEPKCIRCDWLKLLTMYSYSMPLELIDDFPAELVIPALRNYVFAKWVRIKGGVYSYIEKILARFRGKILLNTKITEIRRIDTSVQIQLSDGRIEIFDKVVFATPPDRILKLLVDPTFEESKRFSAWQSNHAQTIIHTDTSMYNQYGIKQASEFDFFQMSDGWGYNASLNQLCGLRSPQQYSLAFHLDQAIATDKIIHVQKHDTPLYTVEALHYRNEVMETNGENHTYYAGAYLGDGLHEGAIASAMRVAQLIGV